MKKPSAGFTIIELVVVIVIIGILATISIVGFTSIQQGARNTQRSSKIASIAEALEKYYYKNGEYPTCAMMTAQPASAVVSTVLPGLDPDTLTAPQATAGTNSFQCSDPATPLQFGYLIGVTSYTLEYKEEGSSNIPPLASRHNVISPIYALTLTGINCTPTGAGSYEIGTSTPIGCDAAQFYTFNPPTSGNWSGSTGCSTGSPITVNTDKHCTATAVPTPISAPATPTVTPNTVGATTTWSWGAASCPGNTARYQYRYTISPSGYNSGLVATAGTSVAFTTSTEGQTYTVAVQAQCYNPVTSSSWSASGSGSYLRPITYQTLTLASSGNGSVSGGGSYATGSSPTMTASPNTYYSLSSWTGSTGCSGAASHTITMDAAKSCTANFTPTAIATPATPGVTANTAGATTTWSWGAASCPGNSAYYLYRYTNTSGYDSGWPGTSATSVAFTTSTGGITYTVQVQAECYNAVTSSAWSGAGSAAYYRPYYTVSNEYHLSGGVSWNYNNRWANLSTASMNGWDSNLASVTLSSGESAWFILGGFTAGSIPSNATVSQVRLRASLINPTNTTTYFYLCQNTDGSNDCGNREYAGAAIGTAANTVLYVTWNNTVSTAVINSWGFGTYIQSINYAATSRTVYVDYVDMAIDYTHP